MDTVQRLSATVPPQLGKSSNQRPHSFGICLLYNLCEDADISALKYTLAYRYHGDTEEMLRKQSPSYIPGSVQTSCIQHDIADPLPPIELPDTTRHDQPSLIFDLEFSFFLKTRA